MINNQLLERHLAWCDQRNLRPTYITTRRRMLCLIERELGARIEIASESDLRDWFESLSVRDEHGKPRAQPATRAAYLSHASAFYEWLVLERVRDDNPTRRLSRPRLQRLLPRPIADDDLTRAISGAPDDVRPWLLLAALMGLRACEIANLRAEDIDRGALIVREAKGGKQRVIPLNPVVTAELERLPAAGWLFPHWSGNGPMKAHNVSHRANRYLHGCGVTATMHQLRHHFGTSLYRESRDLRVTQEMMGHSSPTTTAGYAQWDQHKAATAIQSLRIPA